MIQTFADRRTQELYETGKAKRFSADLARRPVRKLEYIDLANKLDDLKTPPGNRLHALAGDRQGHMRFALTINGEYVSALIMAMHTKWKYATITKGRVGK